jgi:hypothetical protein
MTAEGRIDRARLLYERAIFGGDASALAVAERELNGVEADLALARGRVIHARFLEQRNEGTEQLNEDPNELALFERAAELYQLFGDTRGEGESLFWRNRCGCAGKQGSCLAWRRTWLGWPTLPPPTAAGTRRSH